METLTIEFAKSEDIKAILNIITKCAIITNVLMLIMCFESMLFRMSMLILMYSFIIFIIVRKQKEKITDGK